MFKLTIKTDNAAFADGNLENEIARILRKVAERIERGDTSGSTFDLNGNKVGSFELKDGE